MIITRLLDLLDPTTRRSVRRLAGFVAAYAVVEGICFGLTVPIVAGLLRGTDVTGWLVALVVAALVAMGLRWANIVRAAQVGCDTIRSLQHRTARHLATLPVDWFAPRHAGELPQLAGQGVMALASVVPHQLPPLLGGVLTPAVVLAVAAVADWRVAVVMLVAAPLLVLVHRATVRGLAASEERGHAAAAAATARIVEFAHSQPTLRAAGSANPGRALLTDALAEQDRAADQSMRREISARLGFGIAVQLVLVAVVAVLAWAFTGSAADAALLAAGAVLAVRFTEPLSALADNARSLQGARANAERLRELFAVAPLPVRPDPVPVPGHPDLALDGVSFTYPTGTEPALREVTLSLPAGSTTAVVGPSGAGKSTLLRLLARLADPSEGAVRLGGVDLRDLDPDALYDHVGVALQEIVLLDATILDNVRTGRPEADDALVGAAAAAAGLAPVLERLGRDAPVGPRGTALSGGERQRVALARTVLQNPPVLLLDEATSGLDAVSEQLVGRWLESLRGRATVVVVSHRLHTVRGADRIVLVEDGAVTAVGTHEELSATCPGYLRLTAGDIR